MDKGTDMFVEIRHNVTPYSLSKSYFGSFNNLEPLPPVLVYLLRGRARRRLLQVLAKRSEAV